MYCLAKVGDVVASKIGEMIFGTSSPGRLDGPGKTPPALEDGELPPRLDGEPPEPRELGAPPAALEDGMTTPGRLDDGMLPRLEVGCGKLIEREMDAGGAGLTACEPYSLLMAATIEFWLVRRPDGVSG